MANRQVERFTRPPFARMSWIHETLSRNTFPNATRLAQRLEVTPRTIKRDIEFMRDRLNLPIEYHPTKGGYYYTAKVDQFPTLSVTEAELFALLVAHKVVTNYHGTPFAKPLQAAFNRLAGVLDSKTRYSLENLSEVLSFRPLAPEDADLKIFETLTTAMRHRQAVAFQYRKLASRKWETRRVYPYHLACIENHWYLIAHDTRRKAMRNFALSRMRQMQRLKESFTVPKEFKAEEYLRGNFMAFKGSDDYEVVIDFDPWASDLLRGRKWHSSQQWQELPDGSSRMWLRLNSIEELEGWVLGWGAHATVVRPRALAERISRAASQVVQKYSAVVPPQEPPAAAPADLLHNAPGLRLSGR